MTPIFRPTWRPLTTTPRTRWIPRWTTARPFYNHSKHTTDYHDPYDLYDHVREENQYKDHGSHHLDWKPSGNLGRPSGSNYGSQLDWKEVGNQKNDQEAQGTYHTDRPEESWLHGYKNPDYPSSSGYYPPGYHYHYHHHHYHNYGPIPKPSENTNANPAATNDQKYNPGYYPPNTDNNWRPSYNYDHNSRHYDYHHFEHTAPNKTNPFQFPGRNDGDDTQFHDRYNETKFDTDRITANRKPNYDYSLNRQNYSRTIPGLYHHNFNQTSSSVGNIFPNSSNKSIENWHQIQGGLRQDKQSPSIGQENIVWNQPNRSNFKPSTWHGQENRGKVQTENQTDPWVQGK